MNFNRIASFPVIANLAEAEDQSRESSPEIIDVTADGIVRAVNGSFYLVQPSIFEIGTTQRPARIVDVIRVVRQDGNPAQRIDMEGIALDGEGGFYLASDGCTGRVIPRAICHVTAEGVIRNRTGEICLPPELMAVGRRFGVEGVTKVGETMFFPIGQVDWSTQVEEAATVRDARRTSPARVLCRPQA
ncbi:MAG: esterase-like activity of phytase family protein [Rhodobacter sp.]|nr:esterase-like activity of phytase family protein [Rhodobacter sp.]